MYVIVKILMSIGVIALSPAASVELDRCPFQDKQVAAFVRAMGCISCSRPMTRRFRGSGSRERWKLYSKRNRAMTQRLHIGEGERTAVRTPVVAVCASGDNCITERKTQ